MNTATATLTAPLPTRNRLALVGFAGLIGLAAALQVSIAAAGICLGITLTFWVLSLVVQHQRVQVPGMFVPLLVYAAADARLFSFRDRPARELHRRQTAHPVSHRASGVPPGARPTRIDGPDRGHYGRRVERTHWDRSVPASSSTTVSAGGPKAC